MLDHPFEDATYFSAVLPPRLYKQAEEYFPPTAALRPATLSAHSKRYKVDGVRELLRLSPEAKDAFRNFSATVEAWYTTSEPFMNGRRKPWWKTFGRVDQRGVMDIARSRRIS